jgi:hypothetical protein
VPGETGSRPSAFVEYLYGLNERLVDDHEGEPLFRGEVFGIFEIEETINPVDDIGKTLFRKRIEECPLVLNASGLDTYKKLLRGLLWKTDFPGNGSALLSWMC